MMSDQATRYRRVMASKQDQRSIINARELSREAVYHVGSKAVRLSQ